MMKATLFFALLTTALMAGCLSGDEPTDTTDDAPDDVMMDPDAPVHIPDLLNDSTAVDVAPIVLERSVVDAAVDMTGDLYEPTMEVCDDGSIYITGHTIAVDTTGAPVFGSHDDGETWAQLPWFMDQTLPEPVHGATPPVSDEIFLACGDDGWLYGSDITLASYPVNAWSGYGTMHEYWNFNAYDETQAAQQAGACDTLGAVPAPAPVKDRPWAAYANGTLLLTSNPAGGANQIGVVDVPFAAPAPWSLGSVIDGIEWNLCAGPGGSIPGIPDIREDGLIAAPQRSGGALWLTLADKTDIMNVENVKVFNHTTGGEITSVYGIASFDANGDLFVGITNNTEQDPNNGNNRTGQMRFAVSQDGGQTFTERVFVTGDEGNGVRHFYMDPNAFGPGALVVWALDGQDGGYDWYMGHLQVGDDGRPVLENVSLVIDEGPQPSAHVTGAAVGPDGRSYTAMYTTGSGTPAAPTTPMEVWIQRDGPTLPVTVEAEAGEPVDEMA